MSSQPRSRTYRVIWNTVAGSRAISPAPSVDRTALLALMAEHGLGDDLVETASEDEGRAAARAAVTDGVDVVVSAGGDGTIGLIAAELLGAPAALGVLPLGTVMNVTRMLGLPRELPTAAEIVREAPIREIDVGRAGDALFLETGSVGMNAAIFREVQRFDDGDWASILRTVWVALRYRPARMEIALDQGTVRTRALMIVVANGPYLGAGMTVAPEARLDDGLFDVRVFRGFSKLDLLRHLTGIAFGRRRYEPHISTYRSRRVTVRGARPLPCRADSRDLGTTPVEFEARPRALRVVAPDPGPS
ncbi:MAG TPA: diacylglycerol kinase family protein [Candidatus Limnocylindrales bacterium]